MKETGRELALKRMGGAIPAAPFAEWLNEWLEREERQDLFFKPQSRVIDSVRTVAEQLGVSDKWVYRHKHSLDDGGQPTDLFARNPIEDALARIGKPISDLYPELGVDVELEPDIFCESCRTTVTPIGGLCPWCTPEPGHSFSCPRCGGWKGTRKASMCQACRHEVGYPQAVA